MRRWDELLDEVDRRAAAVMHDRTAVTVGRAAEMLRMSARQVVKYIHAQVLPAEPIELPRRGRRRERQWMLRKGEVRQFQRRLEDWRRRHPTRWTKQIALPLEIERPGLPPAWAFEQLRGVRPVMARAKVPDQELQPRRSPKGSRHVA